MSLRFAAGGSRKWIFNFKFEYLHKHPVWITIQYTTVQRLASEALLIPGKGKEMDLKRWREHPWTREEGLAYKEDPLPWYFFLTGVTDNVVIFSWIYRTIARRFARPLLLILHRGGG